MRQSGNQFIFSKAKFENFYSLHGLVDEAELTKRKPFGFDNGKIFVRLGLKSKEKLIRTPGSRGMNTQVRSLPWALGTLKASIVQCLQKLEKEEVTNKNYSQFSSWTKQQQTDSRGRPISSKKDFLLETNMGAANAIDNLVVLVIKT